MYTPTLPTQIITGAATQNANRARTNDAPAPADQFSQALAREIGQRQRPAAPASAPAPTPVRQSERTAAPRTQDNRAASAAPGPGAPRQDEVKASTSGGPPVADGAPRAPSAASSASSTNANADSGSATVATEAESERDQDPVALAPITDMLVLVASFNLALGPTAAPATSATPTADSRTDAIASVDTTSRANAAAGSGAALTAPDRTLTALADTPAEPASATVVARIETVASAPVALAPTPETGASRATSNPAQAGTQANPTSPAASATPLIQAPTLAPSGPVTVKVAGDGAAVPTGARQATDQGLPDAGMTPLERPSDTPGNAAPTPAPNPVRTADAGAPQASVGAALRSAPSADRPTEAVAPAPASNTLDALAPSGQARAVHELMQNAVASPSDKLAARVGTPAWDRQLGQKIVWMAAGGDHSATLTLNPPDLGPLQVVVSVHNNLADATFSSAQSEVRQALEAALPKLREMMSDAGITMGNATVGTGLPNQQQNTGEQARFAQTAARSDGNARAADTAAAPSGVAPRNVQVGLVDTFA